MPEDLSSILESPEHTLLATGLGATEGPLWHPGGYLTLVDLGGRLLKWDPGVQINEGISVLRENTGELGDAFLQHIERTRVILHLVDVGSQLASSAPMDAYHTVRVELEKYSTSLAAREEIVVGNKIDLTDGEAAARKLAEEIGRDVLPISAVSGKGIGKLVELLWSVVQRAKESAPSEAPVRHPPHLD